MTRLNIGLCLLALGACEAAQTPTASEPSATAASAVSTEEAQGPSAVAPAESAVAEAPKPEPGTLETQKLTGKAGANRDDALLEAHCRVLNRECDLATIRLTVDGQPIALQVPGATEAAPYGDWASLKTYRSDDGMLMLSMKFASHYQHLGLVLQDGAFAVQNNTKWPTELSGELVAAADWPDGAIRYRCDAFAMGWTPVDCENLVISVGENELLHEEGVVGGNIEAKVLRAGAKNALRISTTPLDGEWAPVWTRIFASVDGKTVPVWDSMSRGEHSYAEDGSWEVVASECRKPAVLDYDEELNEETIKRHGTEAFTKRRFAWNGIKVTSKVIKRWTDTHSACQTEGRCPHVYAGDEAVFLGEILRNRVGKAAWANEFVEVPRELVRNGTLKIRLAEEKPNERSFVDGVWLVVDGVRVEPAACASPLCERDGQTQSMSTGEAAQVQFTNIPKTGTIRFFASGYYVYEQ